MINDFFCLTPYVIYGRPVCNEVGANFFLFLFPVLVSCIFLWPPVLADLSYSSPPGLPLDQCFLFDNQVMKQDVPGNQYVMMQLRRIMERERLDGWPNEQTGRLLL